MQVAKLRGRGTLHLTLVHIVSFERRKAVAVPFGTRTSRSMYRRSCAVWIASLSISLAHPKICTNIAFGAGSTAVKTAAVLQYTRSLDFHLSFNVHDL